MQITEQRYYSIEEYLALEEAADYKSEYIDGEIFPMAGGSTNHNQIALNFSWGLFLGNPEQQQAELEGTLKLQKVKVRFFQKVVGFILEGDRRHPRQKKIKEGPRDSFGKVLYVDYKIDLPDRSLNEFSLWVNKHMENVQVMWPPSLAEKHRQAARDLCDRYNL